MKKMKSNKLPKKRSASTFLFVILIILAGGLLILGIMDLQAAGQGDIFSGLAERLSNYTTYGIILLIFLFLIPILLIALAIFSIRRRRRIDRFVYTWENAVQETVAQVEREIAERAEEEKKAKEPRFHELISIDKSPTSRVLSDKDITSLEVFCTKFQYFAAGQLELFYSIRDIRAFVAGLAVSHIIILQGISGTGKTSLAYAFGKFLGNPSTIIPVQPMWKERSDLLGYFNEFTKNYNETELLKKIYAAGRGGDDEKNDNKIHIVVLDEMNIARVEYYFADFLSTLEIPVSQRSGLPIVSSRWANDPKGLTGSGDIEVPENMWFIGTINNDDSTFSISDKVYDRAIVLDFNSRAEVFEVPKEYRNQKAVSLSFQRFTQMVNDESEWFALTKRNENRLRELDAYLIEKFQITFGNRIMKQIHVYVSVYVACGGDELEALDDILCRKVFRKMASLNANYFRNEVEELHRKLNDIFGDGRMAQCLDYIERMKKSM